MPFFILKNPNIWPQCTKTVQDCRFWVLQKIFQTVMVWCMGLWVSLRTPSLKGMGWLLLPWLFAVALGCCELRHRLWGQREGKPLAIGDARAWRRLYSTGLCTTNRNSFSDLEGALISSAIFLIFMFCHLGFFFLLSPQIYSLGLELL